MLRLLRSRSPNGGRQYLIVQPLVSCEDLQDVLDGARQGAMKDGAWGRVTVAFLRTGSTKVTSRPGLSLASLGHAGQHVVYSLGGPALCRNGCVEGRTVSFPIPPPCLHRCMAQHQLSPLTQQWRPLKLMRDRRGCTAGSERPLDPSLTPLSRSPPPSPDPGPREHLGGSWSTGSPQLTERME